MAKTKQRIVIPDWMQPYLKLFNNTGGNDPQDLLDSFVEDKYMLTTNVVRYMLAMAVLAQMTLLNTLKDKGMLPESVEA